MDRTALPVGPPHAPQSLAILVVLLLAAGLAHGQETETPRELLLFREMPTVVSATGGLQPLSEAPAAMSVLSEDDIRASGAQNIPDLLRSVPGLDYARASASNVAIAARGLSLLNRSRMQVVVDGLPIYEDVLGLIYWHQIPLAIDEIKQIEVIKGPATAIYGDRAFAGLVNIITKTPDDLRGTFLRQSVGNAGTEITDVINAGGTGPVRYKLALGYERTNQFPTRPRNGQTEDEGRGDFRAHLYGEYRLGEGSRLSLTEAFDKFDQREVINVLPGLAAGFGKSTISGYLGWTQINYSLDEFQAQVSHNYLNTDIESPTLTTVGLIRLNALQASARQGIKLGESHLLTAGLTYRFVAVESQQFVGNVQQHLGNFFLQHQWTLTRNLFLTTAVGLDVHPWAGVSVSPRVAIVYAPTVDHTFRASVARATRNPSLLENFLSVNEGPSGLQPRPGPLTPPQFNYFGNKDLRPEKMLAFEVGYQGEFFRRVRARTDLYYYRLSDLIAQAADVESAFFNKAEYHYQNVSGGNVYGLEVGGDATLTRWLTGSVGYALQKRHGEDTCTHLAANVTVTNVQQELPCGVSAMGLSSQHRAYAGLTAAHPFGLSATVRVNYVGAAELFPASQAQFFSTNPAVHAYTLLSVGVGYRFKFEGIPVEVAVDAFNVNNDRHREVPGGDVIDRRVVGTLKGRF